MDRLLGGGLSLQRHPAFLFHVGVERVQMTGCDEEDWGGGEGSIIKVAEPEPHNLCIYSSQRKLRLKRSGHFPGH